MTPAAATAAIVYCSRTGITQRYAREIGAHLAARGFAVRVDSVADADLAAVAAADLVLLGSWTSGLFVVRQHPDGPWLSFVRALPSLRGRVGLFTTYRILAGSVFSRMREALPGAGGGVDLELRSRDGTLSASDRAALDAVARSIEAATGPAVATRPGSPTDLDSRRVP